MTAQQQPLYQPRKRLRLSIVIVDDDRDSAQALSYLLERFGYRVCVADRFDAAVDVCAERRPDVVVTDISLADGDGCDLADRLRAGSRGVTLIALTGHTDRATHSRIRAAGFDAKFSKPLEFGALRDYLSRVAER